MRHFGEKLARARMNAAPVLLLLPPRAAAAMELWSYWLEVDGGVERWIQ